MISIITTIILSGIVYLCIYLVTHFSGTKVEVTKFSQILPRHTETMNAVLNDNKCENGHFFPHKFNMLPEAATKHKVANQNEDFTHIYIYIYLLGYIQKLIQIPASFLCAICSASIFSFTVYKLSWPSQMLVEAISCSYSVLYFQYKKWADKLWHRHRTKLAEVLLTGHSQMLYRPTPPKTTPFHRVNKNLL